MERDWNLLVVSARLENKKALLDILRDFPVDVLIASTVAQAQEAMSGHLIQCIFSEENLPDGSYRDVLAAMLGFGLKSPLVLMLCTGEWQEYIEAMKLGAAEVIRSPLQAIDVELALIHMIREQRRMQEGREPLQPKPSYPEKYARVTAAS
jgi:DNA-binding NtrC family response regulator